ncbi:hypothetical protein ACHHYP_20693 [Achlya hypogyna]|uniref:WRKY19-like zinc finger domain-containing protein n=1 Tax=Achlya hypogyna TaxID=1202772 RepID=A0A1V9YEK8_ACHHY|nr:hypothetical protein ACHHYP_20693 [Achlya hypogyna]
MTSICRYDYCVRFAKQIGLCLTHFRWVYPAAGGNCPSSALASPIDSTTTDSKFKLKYRNRKCRSDNCFSYARSGGFCTRHGGGRKCKYANCATASQTGGFCRLHGGGSRCRIKVCARIARIGGLCLQHSRSRLKTEPLLQPLHKLHVSPSR